MRKGGPPAARKRRRSAGHEEEEFAAVRKWRSRGGGRVGEEVEEVATAGKERMDAGEGRRGSPADGTRLAAEGGRGGAARLLVRPAAFISSRTGVSESRRGGRWRSRAARRWREAGEGGADLGCRSGRRPSCGGGARGLPGRAPAAWHRSSGERSGAEGARGRVAQCSAIRRPRGPN